MREAPGGGVAPGPAWPGRGCVPVWGGGSPGLREWAGGAGPPPAARRRLVPGSPGLAARQGQRIGAVGGLWRGAALVCGRWKESEG